MFPNGATNLKEASFRNKRNVTQISFVIWSIIVNPGNTFYTLHGLRTHSYTQYPVAWQILEYPENKGNNNNKEVFVK